MQVLQLPSIHQLFYLSQACLNPKSFNTVYTCSFALSFLSSLVKPVQRRNGKSIPSETTCPKCGAPHHYIYDNNGNRGQFQCKVCGQNFNESNYISNPIVLVCLHCGHTLTQKKDRKHFRIHKRTNPKCSYYLDGIKRLPTALHIYRIFKT